MFDTLFWPCCKKLTVWITIDSKIDDEKEIGDKDSET